VGNSGGGGSGCFLAGTKIDTPSGSMAIENVRVGDSVWSYDTREARLVMGVVSRVFVHPSQPSGTLRLNSGSEIRATPNHPFFRQRNMSEIASRYAEETSELQVVSADELVAGDVVYARNASSGELVPTTVSGFTLDGPTETVYNFTVEGTHSYFAEGVLVHNK